MLGDNFVPQRQEAEVSACPAASRLESLRLPSHRSLLDELRSPACPLPEPGT